MATSRRFIPLKKPGLTPLEILRSTPQVTHDRAKNVAITNVRQKTNEEGQLYFTSDAKSIRNDDGTPRRGADTYKCAVTLTDPTHRYIKVDCTCMFHPFSGSEVSLNLRNAADILRSNGRAPKVRNPGMLVFACKHLVAFMMRLHDLGKIR